MSQSSLAKSASERLIGLSTFCSPFSLEGVQVVGCKGIESVRCVLSGSDNWDLDFTDIPYYNHWMIISFSQDDAVFYNPVPSIYREYMKDFKPSIVYVANFKVEYVSQTGEGLLDYFDSSNFSSAAAYSWAAEMGDADIVIDRITDSEYAYLWALTIGNRDIMIDRIAESKWVDRWVEYIGNREYFEKKGLLT